MSWFTWFDDVITSWDDDSLLNGGDGNDLLISVGDDNTLKGGTGDDLLISFGDDNTLRGGAGNDTLISYGDYNSLFGGSGYDILESKGNYNDLHGGSGADFVLSVGHHNTLLGGGGADLVISFGDFNTLDGGGGSDYLMVNGSNNTLRGGRGNDIIDSRYDSSDLIIYDGRTSDYSFEHLGYGKVRVIDLNLDNGNEGRDLIIGGEFLQFSNGVYDLASLLAGVVNTPPDVVNEGVEVDEEGILAAGSAPLTGNVLDNDTDLDEDILSLVAAPAPQDILFGGNVIGSVVIGANGDYTVTLDTVASQALG